VIIPKKGKCSLENGRGLGSKLLNLAFKGLVILTLGNSISNVEVSHSVSQSATQPASQLGGISDGDKGVRSATLPFAVIQRRKNFFHLSLLSLSHEHSTICGYTWDPCFLKGKT
jgi:hypothetical protein